MNTYGEISAFIERMKNNPFIDMLFKKHENEQNEIELYKNIAKGIIDKYIFKYTYNDIFGKTIKGAQIMIPRTFQDDLLIYKIKDIEDKTEIMRILYNTNVDSYFRFYDVLGNVITINLYDLVKIYYYENSYRIILHSIINKDPISLKDNKEYIILVPTNKTYMKKVENIYNCMQAIEKDEIEKALKDIYVEIYKK